VPVRVGNETIHAICDEEVAEGDPAVVAIRPEKFRFQERQTSDPAPGMNHLNVTVRETTFVGEMRRYVLETGFGTQIVLKQQQRYGVSNHEPGDRVGLTWHVEDTRVVADER
jgi:ABC-type Fe3+/spermidine/putrescine transport system ATPase subunit